MGTIAINQTLEVADHIREVYSEPRLNEYVSGVLDHYTARRFEWINTRHRDEIPEIGVDSAGLVNVHRINDIRRVNKFFEQANRLLVNGQYLVITMETKNARKQRLLNKFPKGFNWLYYSCDFVFKRIFPKWKPTRSFYFSITKGHNRVMSITEGLGRLICCGFEIVDYKRIGFQTCIIAKKVDEPAYDMQPTYGALIRLRRVGLKGKVFQVFKLRTMHPYSEYLQDFVFKKYDLEDGGKFKNDFRMTTWGTSFRKYWIDEFPMFMNVFRGEMKLVGVRPLSEHYFSLYPEDLQQMRIKVKPGLVPPYYADMPNGMNEILESERNYLKAYAEKPIRTDLKYFSKAFVNIVFKGARSG